MIAETLSVGTELLLGDTVDTNAVHLARLLPRLGVSLFFRTTVGDNPDRIRASLRLALSRADVVLTIGGLGPTEDDLTKEMVAEVLGVALTEDAGHRQWLEGWLSGRTGVPHTFWKQALVPAEGQGLPNPNGTALGALFEKEGKSVLCLPGPPNEFVPMVEASVEPFLRERTSGRRTVILSRTLRIVGLGESLVEEKCRDLMQSDNPTVAPYAKTSEVHLRITARAGSPAEAQAMISDRETALRGRLGDVVYGVDGETLEGGVVGMLKVLGRTVALAESCTGGLIAKRLTDVPDASHVFDLGLVTYSNESKTEFAHVPADLIACVGAVSPEVALAMAEGARQAGKADFGLSVTGIAGPGGGSEAKPVGTVHIGLAWEGGAVSEHHHLLGRRVDIAQRASQNALALLRRFLLNPDAPQFQEEAGT